MDRVGEEGSICYRELELRADVAVVISEYGRGISEFLQSLERATSDYELMVANQSYLLAVADLLRNASRILDCRVISPTASLFEAAAWAFIDSKDYSAHLQNIDGRFVLSSQESRFVRSRLKSIAQRAHRIRQIYSKEIEASSNPRRSALKFLLEVFLDLPVSAWEFAPCLAMKGNCKACGYAVDHGACAESGSAYDMLSSSREAILRIIRSSLSVMKRQSMNGGLEQNIAAKERHEGSIKLAFTRIESGLCGDYEVVEACD